jgi:hypothetical protein
LHRLPHGLGWAGSRDLDRQRGASSRPGVRPVPQASRPSQGRGIPLPRQAAGKTCGPSYVW